MPRRTDEDEGPSQEDVERYGDDAGSDEKKSGHCPHCGASVFDDADLCPKCHAWITGDVVRHHPASAGVAKRAIIAIVVLLIGTTIYFFLRMGF
ncbi:MAG: hypothetical protein O2800_04040 [Planctomycetota bacterium]|nr:hypothetical protein [Planctomycetota bacterium]